jgi:hypothetical protein
VSLDWNNLLWLAIGAFMLTLGRIVRDVILKGFGTYFDERAKGLATRQDVEAITRKVEKIRTEYAEGLERLKADLGHDSYVTKTQYDLELKAYQEIWPTVLEVRRAVLSLRPAGWDLDYRLSESDDDRRHRRQERLKEAFESFFKAVYGSQPFYHESVYSPLDVLRDLISTESYEYATGEGLISRQEQREEAEKNAEAILRQCALVCERIRERIGSVRVIRDDR